jgi:acetyltransferase
LEDAVQSAREMGFPVVMKVLSRDISHKTEADGVQADLRSENDVREGYRKIMEGARAHKPDATVLGVTLQPMIRNPDYEILMGAKKNRDFGPVLVFGMGGILAEALGDRAIGLAPINRSLARMVMEGTKLFTLLRGYRNRPAANLPALEEIFVRLSHLVEDFPEILEVDMNPVIVKDGQACVADARFFPSALILNITNGGKKHQEGSRC